MRGVWARRRRSSKTVSVRHDDYATDLRIDYNTVPAERYIHLKPIGRGSYGHVHCGTDNERHTEVAIKFIELPTDEQDHKRVLREIHCLRHLRHKNLLGLADMCGIFSRDAKVAFVTPLYEYTLHRLIYRHNIEFTTVQRLHIFYGLLRGIAYMHRHGFCHRDVKPDNVLLNKDCDPVLADFGLAREVNGQGDKLSCYVVTRWYRAPELLYEIESYDASVDLWALGCVLAEMITGEALFQGPNDREQVRAINRVLGASETVMTTFDEFCEACAPSCRVGLAARLSTSTSVELDLLERILVPRRRPSATELCKQEHGGHDDTVKPLILGASLEALKESLRLEIDWASSRC